MDNLHDYLKVKEAALFLGVSESTLRNWERSGKIESQRHPVNGYRLFRRTDLANFLAAMAAEPDQGSAGESEPSAGRHVAERSLVLDSLVIRNFRTFEHLHVERLGRVNLVVGRNNVGKSSLLEAIRLYMYEGNEEIIWEILQARDESQLIPGKVPDSESATLVSFERIMTEQHHLDPGGDEICIGPSAGRENVLSLRVEEQRQGEGPGKGLGALLGRADGNEGEEATASGDLRSALVIRMGRTPIKAIWWEALHDPGYWRFSRRVLRPKELVAPCSYLPPREMPPGAIASWWDSVALTELEEDVLEGLRLLEPAVERLQFVQRSGRSRVPVVKLKGAEGPVPLRSMGGGMNRILAILLALVSARGGTLLVDEVENGIHYSVQQKLWRLILAVAQRINVQVFATTHSWDCIEAFQEAVNAAPGQQGYLIRLSRREGKVQTVVFDERQLAIATRQEIEVR